MQKVMAQQEIENKWDSDELEAQILGMLWSGASAGREERWFIMIVMMNADFLIFYNYEG